MLAAPIFRKIGEQLGQIKTEIKRVENREGMDADEKRARINELQKLLAQTAKKGYDVAERAGIAR
jgi:ribosomal protein S20